MSCPRCGDPNAWTRCWTCGWTPDQDVPVPPKGQAVKDDRSEEQIRIAIRRALELHGFVVIDLEQGYRRDGTTRVRKGLPDLYIMGYGVGVWRELKSARGQLTPEQEAFGEDCRRCGIDWDVWRHEREAITWAEKTKEAMSA